MKLNCFKNKKKKKIFLFLIIEIFSFKMKMKQAIDFFTFMVLVFLVREMTTSFVGVNVNRRKKSETSKVEVNFETQVKRFCENKPQVNFCSPEHIDIMLKIEKKRVQTLELARQLKRMENEILKKVFNI
jgi:hypothetical protein